MSCRRACKFTEEEMARSLGTWGWESCQYSGNRQPAAQFDKDLQQHPAASTNAAAGSCCIAVTAPWKEVVLLTWAIGAIWLEARYGSG